MSNYPIDMSQAKGEMRKTKKVFFALCVFFVITLLTGCSAIDAVSEGVSGISDYFLGGEDNTDPPSLLVEYTPEVKLQHKNGLGHLFI